MAVTPEASDVENSFGPFRYPSTMNARQLSILMQIGSFYDDDKIKNLLHPIATQTYPVSLRALDWLAVNFSKKTNVVYPLEINSSTILVNISQLYKEHLKYWRRKHFDPFRRRSRIHFVYENSFYPTTIGQLNFISWASKYKILDYAKSHLREIESEMTSSLLNSKKRKDEQTNDGRKRTRTELSRRPISKCFVYNIEIKVNF